MKNPILVALDYSELQPIRTLLEEIADHIAGVKIGLELIHSLGSERCIDFLSDFGVSEIFYDAKLDDIPNTVAGAARAIARLRVQYFNVMAAAGPKAIEEAVANRGDAQVLVVTVLTSLSEEQCLRIFGLPIIDKVRDFALMAAEAGADGLICSAQHLPLLKQLSQLQRLKFVTPGIRSPQVGRDDQSQVETPAGAMNNGAYRLVIGREITKSDNPRQACERILHDIEAAAIAEKGA